MNNRKHPSLFVIILVMLLGTVGAVSMLSYYLFPSILHYFTIEKKITTEHLALWIILLMLTVLSMSAVVYAICARYIRKLRPKMAHEEAQDHNSKAAFPVFNGKKLKRTDARLAAVLNEMHVAMLMLAQDGTVVYSNNAIKKIYPDIAKYVGKPFTHVIHEKSLQSRILSLSHDTTHLTTEMIINNTLYLVSISNLAHTKMRIVMFSKSSIPKELEIMKNDFIANASHELKTPTTTIKGYVDLLKEEPHNVEKYIDIIDRNTDRIIHIIHNLLVVSKLESNQLHLHYETFALDELIKNVGYYFENILKKKKLKLKIKLHTRPIYIEADKAKIQELLNNLLDNAIKYTDDGNVGIHTSRDYDEIVIIIRDTGIGISKKYYARIFERFFVVDKSRFREVSGTGLGLSIVKQIVQLHKGRTSVTSKVGIGTDITVRIPIKKPYS